MWEEAFRLAVQSGIFAVLFCCLLIYELKISGKREAKYQKTIQTLSDALMSMRLLRNDIEEIDKIVNEISAEVKKLEVRRKKSYDVVDRQI